MSAELLGARRLREVLDRHGVHPSRALGQNFVIDPNTIRKVVEAADVGSGAHVLEIGPGAGSLTLALAQRADRVTAVEVDRYLLPVLAEVLGGVPNVEIVHADALRFDLAGTDATDCVANLPYNVAVPVIMRLLAEAGRVVRLTVMTQKEVGERLAASPGSRTYGAPTVLAAYDAQVSVVGSISRRAFWPVPNVDSVLLRLVRRDPPDVDRNAFAAVVRTAFGQRRKTLRRALEPLLGEGAAGALTAAGIDPGDRAERVPLEGFVRLAKVARLQD